MPLYIYMHMPYIAVFIVVPPVVMKTLVLAAMYVFFAFPPNQSYH
jgi:hypothetical protein